MDSDSALLLRVFTHPACSGCGEAVRDAWAVSMRKGGFQLRTIDLSSKEGLAEAHAAKVRVLPTLILSRGEAPDEIQRWVGAPGDAALDSAIAAAS